MESRSTLLETFVAALDEAFAVAPMEAEAEASVARIFEALRVAGTSGTVQGTRIPVCRHLGNAYSFGRSGSAQLARVTDAFAALEPNLKWAVRPANGPFASENWSTGHANSMIIGQGGLEQRKDVAVGASLLAPDVRYPDHNHGPEEVYLILSPGRFQHGNSGWFEPGVGGTLYNEPNIRHAMASDNAPLLAFWCLWVGSQPPADLGRPVKSSE
ncbi:dimethylsulfonioproprionate lyase family protein [Mesorhizobium sp. M0029]|uniref:dimethylsulfonioproprionate lyase family protein n=1 Tax=Mesorhizobium sp. M0029 TaxID=2956850 RepID=UPI003334BBDC